MFTPDAAYVYPSLKDANIIPHHCSKLFKEIPGFPQRGTE